MLKLTPTVKESSNDDQNTGATIDFTIRVKGVADAALVNIKDLKNPDTSDYDANAGIIIVDKDNVTHDINNGAEREFYSDDKSITVYGLENSVNGIPLGLFIRSGENKGITTSDDPVLNNEVRSDSDLSEKMSYIVNDLPANLTLVDKNGNAVGSFLKSSGSGNDTKISWTLSQAEIDAGIFVKTPQDYSGIISNLKITAITIENDGHSITREIPFSLKVNPVVATTNPFKDISGVEDASGTDDSRIIIQFNDLNDSSGSEQITSIKIPFAQFDLDTGSGLTLFVKNGENWVTAESAVGSGVTKDGTYYILDNYTGAGRIAVGVDPGAAPGVSLVHKHKPAGELKINDVVVTVRDGGDGAGVTAATKDFTGNITVTLEGVADKPDITSFSATETAPGAITFNIGSAVTFPDTDGSETHYYTIKVPQAGGFGFNKGYSNGDGTWFFTGADLTGLQLKGPGGYGAASLTLTAYAVEGDTKTDLKTIEITIPEAGGGGGDPEVTAQLPTLATMTAQTNEDTATTLDKLVNFNTTKLNDSDGASGSERLDFILSGLPDGVKIEAAAGISIYHYTVDGVKKIRVNTNIGENATPEDIQTVLSKVTITPPKDFSGEITFRIDAVATELNSSIRDFRTVGSVNNAKIEVMPVADPFNLTGNMGSTAEDTMTPVKFSVLPSDTDGSETVADGITIAITGGKGEFVYVDGGGNVLGSSNSTLSVKLIGGAAYYNDGTADRAVLYRPPLNEHGKFDISVTAHTADSATINGGTVTVNGGDITKIISVTVDSVPDLPNAEGTNGLIKIYADGGYNSTPPENTYSATEDTAVQIFPKIEFFDKTDGSELHTVLIRNMPAGATLVNNSGTAVGSKVSDTEWELKPSDLANVWFKPGLNQSGLYTLTLVARVVEKDRLGGFDPAVNEAVQEFKINVSAVADGAIITAHDVTNAKESQLIKFDLEGKLIEQGELETSPVVFPGGNISDEKYNLSLTGAGVTSNVKFYTSIGGIQTLLADADANITNGYQIAGITQTQMDNLYLHVENSATGSFTFNAAVNTVDGGSPESALTANDTIKIDISADVSARSINAGNIADYTVNGITYGGSGNDSISGGAENNTIKAAGGDDTVNAGAGDDTIYGGTGNDVISGEAGNDIIYGEDGNDTLYGNDGNDAIYGGAGNDTIDGGAGADSIDGGDGNDIIFYSQADGDTIDGGAGNDTLILSAGGSIDFSAFTNAGNTAIKNIEIIDLSQNGNHSLTNITINDLINITDGNNTLIIQGDAGDTVTLKDGDGGNWVKTSSGVVENGVTYDIYDLSGNANALTLKIEQSINENIIV